MERQAVHGMPRQYRPEEHKAHPLVPGAHGESEESHRREQQKKCRRAGAEPRLTPVQQTRPGIPHRSQCTPCQKGRGELTQLSEKRDRHDPNTRFQKLTLSSRSV